MRRRKQKERMNLKKRNNVLKELEGKGKNKAKRTQESMKKERSKTDNACVGRTPIIDKYYHLCIACTFFSLKSILFSFIFLSHFSL